MRSLRDFLAAASTPQQEELARLAKTSRPHLYNLSCGTREASADLARRIELASKKMALKAGLPIIYRGDLCNACAKCEFAQRG